MMSKDDIKSNLKEINFEEWICGLVDPVIENVEILIPDNLTDDQEAVRVYWIAFAQNTINLSRIMSNLPHHLTQVMMTFRLLQESSADIFYLKNNRDNIINLVKIEGELEDLKLSGDFSLRNMSRIVAKTDIRSREAIKSNVDGTQKRIKLANLYLEERFGTGPAKDFGDINKLLNGFTHFNPAGIYSQRNLTDHGYVEMYMRVLLFYPAWLYLVLVSLSELLDIDELNEENSQKIIEELFTRIEESEDWSEMKFISNNTVST